MHAMLIVLLLGTFGSTPKHSSGRSRSGSGTSPGTSTAEAPVPLARGSSSSGDSRVALVVALVQFKARLISQVWETSRAASMPV